MFKMLLDAPFSYVLSLFVGFIIGAGMQLIYGGFLLYSLARNMKSNKHLYFFIGIISSFLGALFIITGMVFFIRLLIDVYMMKAQSFSLNIGVLLVTVALFAMMIPFFIKRHKKQNMHL